MIIDRLMQAVASGDRHEVRQVLMDILETGAMQEFVDWVNRADTEVLRVMAPELQIIEMPDGSMYLELLPDEGN